MTDQIPADKKPVDALPDGWRLADHQKYGRVIVTNPTPNRDGYVYCVHFSDRDSTRFDWGFCDPAELTYTDQEAGTPDKARDLLAGTTLAAMIAGMREEYAVSLPDGQHVGVGWGTYDTALEDMNAWRRDGYDARIVRRYVTTPEEA